MPIAENRPVIQMDLEGNFIKQHESMKAAAKAMGNPQKASSIQYACEVNNRYHKKYPTKTLGRKPNLQKVIFGFTWKFKE